MSAPPPVLDRRDRADILAELEARLPAYAPQLRPRRGEAGAAWLDIVARHVETLRTGVNGLPGRSLLSFLELFGASRLPAQSARAPLSFALLDTAPQDVTLPAGSQVAAKVPPPPPSVLTKTSGVAPPAPVFATDTTVSLARAKLVSVYSVDPASDAFADHSQDQATGFTLFAPMQPMPHRLYVGHDSFLKLAGDSEIALSVDFGGAGASATRRPLLIDWWYLSQNGWLPLVTDADTTRRFTEDGVVRLIKDFGPDAKQETYAGRKSYWIRGEISTRRPRARILGAPGKRRLALDDVRQFLIGDAVTVDGSSRATIVSASGAIVELSNDLSGLTPPDLLRLAEPGARDPSAAIVGQRDERTLILADASGFLVGDKVTIDGEAAAKIVSISGDEARLDARLAGRSPQDELTLADSLPPLRPEGLDGGGALPLLDMIRLRVGFSKTGLKPEKVCGDFGELDIDNAFKPFGPNPATFAAVYIASDEVFSRATARLRLEIALAPGTVKSPATPTLQWEYFQGDYWVSFEPRDEFFDTTASLTQGGAVGFVCPQGWKKTKVRGEEKFWLRARIVDGDYGKPMQASVVPDGASYKVVGVPSTLAPPVVTGLRLSYTYYTQPALPDHVVAENDLAFVDHSDEARWPNSFFAPFTPTGDRLPALRLGFSQKLPGGLVSLFFAGGGDPGDAPEPSPFKWEYFGETGWTELPTVDETDGFKIDGVTQFVGPADALPLAGLGGDLYWVRARLKSGGPLPTRVLRGVWTNTLWAYHGESVENETLGISSGEPDQVFVFPGLRRPVLPGERIEVREWTGRGDAWRDNLGALAPERLRFDVDPATNETLAVWVRWEERPHLFASEPADRHYLIERLQGTARFGDGGLGMIPPAGARIRASYTVGGSVDGNVPAGSISELRSGVGYIQSAANPLAARGGASVEQLGATLQRAPQRFANRDRAVTPADYEWLAREATPEVARCRCLATTGADGRIVRGALTLVVTPWSLDARPLPDAALIEKVRDHIVQRMPAGLAGGLRIAGSAYASVAIKARITPLARDGAAAVETRVRDLLTAWLHPLTGGPDGLGWDYGATLYLSTFTRMIEETEGVDHLSWIRLEIDGAMVGDEVAVAPDQLVASGEHQLTLDVGGLGNAA